jgi:hypothetical protein
MPPHPCMRVAVDERELIPRPHPPGHQVKAGACALWRKPVPSRHPPRWRAPASRREREAWLGGNRPAPPGFGCRHRRLAVRCEPRKPAGTTRPPHVPIMPLARCRRCDARRPRAGLLPAKPPLTCRLDRRPRTAWRRPWAAPAQLRFDSGPGTHLVFVAGWRMTRSLVRMLPPMARPRSQRPVAIGSRDPGANPQTSRQLERRHTLAARRQAASRSRPVRPGRTASSGADTRRLHSAGTSAAPPGILLSWQAPALLACTAERGVPVSSAGPPGRDPGR